MFLGSKTLEELRKIINGDDTPDHKSGSNLVSFFNELGFNDKYGQGFPSRWKYTDERLKIINGTPDMDKCIKNTFAVVNYIGRIGYLDGLIAHFNQYLAFDKWQVIRNNDEITFKKIDRVIIEAENTSFDIDESDFLKMTFDIEVDALGLDSKVTEIIKTRLVEAEACIRSEAPLASIFLIGSIMEGILLGIATEYPRKFNQTTCAPKDASSGKVRKFPEWTLRNFIDASAEIGILKYDVQKFSHVLRDFRNYIHPYMQMASQFSPDKQTALICFQVLKAAIYQISKYRNGTVTS